jgi:hypothetical protein
MCRRADSGVSMNSTRVEAQSLKEAARRLVVERDERGCLSSISIGCPLTGTSNECCGDAAVSMGGVDVDAADIRSVERHCLL